MLIIQRPTVEAIDEEQGNRQQFAVGPLDPLSLIHISEPTRPY